MRAFHTELTQILIFLELFSGMSCICSYMLWPVSPELFIFPDFEFRTYLGTSILLQVIYSVDF